MYLLCASETSQLNNGRNQNFFVKLQNLETAILTTLKKMFHRIYIFHQFIIDLISILTKNPY